MSKVPQEDPTSLGHILLEWEVITPAELHEALKQQETLRGDDLLGKLLIANGSCTEEEIATAMSAQASMRAASKSQRAIAVANVALGRRRRQSLVDRRNRIVAQAECVRKSITGNTRQTTTPVMLAKPK